jgi:hypothetical protein
MSGGGNSRIVACQNNSTGGFALHIVSSGETHNAAFTVGGQTVTSTVEMDELRPYLIVGERNGTLDEISITVDGITTTDSAVDGAVAAVSGPLVVGSRWTGSSALDAFEGWIATVFVDLAILASSDREERINYLRTAYGVR